MLKQYIQTKIDNTIYGYVRGEFMPIRVDGQLNNRSEFIIYKSKKLKLWLCDWSTGFVCAIKVCSISVKNFYEVNHA
jgi:hypothetical protein